MKEADHEVAAQHEQAADRPPENQKLSSYDALQLLRDNTFDATAKGAISTLMKIITNILSFPGSFCLGSLVQYS